MNRLIAACLLPAVLAGCAGSASLGAIGSQAPGTLAEIEQLKTAVVTAPLAGCVAVVQQAYTQLHALSNGTPAIPVAQAPAPPILVVPAPPVPVTAPSAPGDPTYVPPAPVPTPTPVPVPNVRAHRSGASFWQQHPPTFSLSSNLSAAPLR